MEVKDGYKMTKIGWIPEDWETKKLGDISELIKRKNGNKAELPVLSISATIGFENQKDKFKKGVIAGNSLKNYTLLNRFEYSYNKGNSKAYPDGCIYRLEAYDEALVPFVYISFKLDEHVSNDYCSHLFSNKRLIHQLRRYITSGARQDGLLNISKEDFFKLSLPLPPLPEQQKIAEILTTVDDKIVSIEGRIQQTEQLKKGLMEKLLTEGIGHTEFKDTKIGRIPVSWGIENINEISHRKSGHTPNRKKPEYWNGDIKWVSLADTYRLDRLYLSETEYTISEEGIKNSSAVKLKKGAVIISRDAGIGKSTIINDVMAVSQHFIAWECGPKLYNIFLYYLLQYWKGKFERIANGTTIKTIGLDFFKKMEVPLPAFPEQRQIANILSTVDDKLDVLHTKKANYETLKKGLMEQLLTGKMRVKP